MLESQPELALGVFAALTGYLIGSIPFAYIFVRALRGVDLRQLGSGNVGAANVLRTTNRPLAAAVVTCDLLKGSAAVLLCRLGGLGIGFQSLTAFAAIVGHIYPVWLRFRGGKGVATAAGVFLVLTPLVTLVAVVVFIVAVAFSAYVSLGSVVAVAVVAPLAFWVDEPEAVVVAAAAAAVLVAFRHRSNLARVRMGTERRLGTHA
ncbi:MAG: glycerol-3-phosphate 1-O-acyltransferase PlsY [Vicinamibacterales bacterium]